MPHKHKRPRSLSPSTRDLPPTTLAKPLPAHTKSTSIFTTTLDKKRKFEERKERKTKKRRKVGISGEGNLGEYKEDDMPRAFRRLMAFQRGEKMRSGLDDGERRSKKQKTTASNTADDAQTDHKPAAAPPESVPTRTSTPTILPGESLSTFSSRVDQSLPLSNVPTHKSRLTQIKGLEKIKQPLTKHNKRLARMQKDWREQDRRARERRLDKEDDEMERREEDEVLWLGAGVDPNTTGRGRKKGKGGKKGDGVDDADPWKVLEKKRRMEGVERKGLGDVVQAPPVLKPVKNIFKDRGIDRSFGITV
jgi:hypothetical protein